MLESFEQATEHQRYNRQWAAGLTIMAADTGRILSLLRCGKTYNRTSFPDTWCNVGGSPDHGEAPYKTALREAKEEIKNLPSINQQSGLQPLFHYPRDNTHATSVDFFTYLAMVPHEFNPDLDKSENSAATWHQWDEAPDAMHARHPGLDALFQNHTAQMILAQRSQRPWQHASLIIPNPTAIALRPAA